MANEQNTIQKKKPNGCLIGCGCFSVVIIIGLLFFGALAYFIISAAKADVKPDLDEFFEKYNNQEMSYICKNLLPSSVSESECMDVLTSMYNDFGKEEEYNLSLLKGTYISISSSNGETKKEIKTKVSFEKGKDVNLTFKIFIDKSGNKQIYYFNYNDN